MRPAHQRALRQRTGRKRAAFVVERGDDELLREGLGRPPQAEEAASPRLPKTAEAVEKLGWDNMNAIFAAHFASEIEAVTEHGGEAVLRERVAALDDGQRQLLREALDEARIAS